ncbi:unknown [Bacteroides sp. CAG:1060]|nr:unknown [Bacteroides sp. CAG:1060]
MVAAQYYRSAYFTTSDGIVECEGYLCPSETVGVEDACLRTYHQVVPSGFFYPADIVVHLVTDIIRSLLCKFAQYLDGQRVALGEIFRILRHAYPSERAETVVEI